MNSRTVVVTEMPTLEAAIAWLRERWGSDGRDIPLQLTERDLLDGLGSPVLTERLLRYLSAGWQDKHTEVRYEDCYVRRCEVCGGRGLHRSEQVRWAYPLWRALMLLAEGAPPRGEVRYSLLVVSLALSAWDWRLAERRLGYADDGHSVLRALRALRRRYEEHATIERAWVDLSDSQQRALTAAYTAA